MTPPPRTRVHGRGRADLEEKRDDDDEEAETDLDRQSYKSWNREMVVWWCVNREIAKEEDEEVRRRGLICSEARGPRCGYRPKCRAVSRRTAERVSSGSGQ